MDNQRLKKGVCNCCPECTAVVMTPGKLYARGHSPDSHSEERNRKAREEITRLCKEGKIKRLYGDDNVSRRPEVQEKISEALIGRVVSDEGRANMSVAAQRRVESNMVNLQKATVANLGSKRSEETKARMSEALRAVRADPERNWSSWSKGKKLPYPVWNKGKTRETDPRIEAYSKAMEGHVVNSGRFEYKRDGLSIMMRSRWEVMFAEKLDFYGLKWEYESRTLEVGPGPWVGTTYTPDFYLPEEHLYIEVKGAWLNGAAEKVAEFRRRYPEKHLLVLTGEVLRDCYGFFRKAA